MDAGTGTVGGISAGEQPVMINRVNAKPEIIFVMQEQLQRILSFYLLMSWFSVEESIIWNMNTIHPIQSLGNLEDDLNLLVNSPPGLTPADNEIGWRMSLDNLAALFEKG